MIDPTTELFVAEAMTAELTDYLLSNQLFRQMIVKSPSGTQQPKMTLGALLSRVEFLQRSQVGLSSEEQEKLHLILSEIETARRVYKTQWEELLRKEIKSNLDSWRWVIQECVKLRGCADSYSGEVRIRMRLELLLSEADFCGMNVLVERGNLRQLDSNLQNLWTDGPFLLSSDLQKFYPTEKFWWLYGRPHVMQDA